MKKATEGSEKCWRENISFYFNVDCVWDGETRKLEQPRFVCRWKHESFGPTQRDTGAAKQNTFVQITYS